METPTTNNEMTETKKYWLTLEQWKDDPAFREVAEKEFLNSPLAEDESATAEGGWARREFLKLMGASLALTSAGCLRRPVQKIIPYVKAPEGFIPGVSRHYASSWVDNGEVFGLLIKTREGRPLKIEGNPSHPGNKGAASARAQSHILSLYDPERLQGPKRNVQNKGKTNRDTINTNWEMLDGAVGAQLKKSGVALLTRSVASPATRALIGEFVRAHNAQWVEWDPVGPEALRAGQRVSYGTEVVPRYRFDEAKLVVAIDADFLGTYLTPVAHGKAWAKARKVGSNMARLVAFESMLSLTGQNADDRYRIKPSQRLDVVMGLIHEVAQRISVDGTVKEIAANFKGSASHLGLDPKLLSSLADELVRARGNGIVIAGGLGRSADDVKVQAAVNMLNSVLDNDGRTIDYRADHKSFRGSSHDLAGLIAKMQAGQISTLIIHDVNPVYQLPLNSGWLEGQRKVEMVVSTADRNDETALIADYVAPDNHSLENWGDAEAVSGVLSLQQPTIQPMYNTRAFQDSLIVWSKSSGRASGALAASDSWYAYLKGHWSREVYSRGLGRELGGNSFEEFWVRALQEGVVVADKGTGYSAARRASAEPLRGAKPSTSKDMELALYPTVGLRDGSLANVSWLQEFPDPVTKIVWDNYLCVSPAYAAKQNLAEGAVVKVKVNDVSVEAPVHIQAGLHDDVVALAVGYGREAAGHVANGVGLNAFHLVAFNRGEPAATGMNVVLEKTTKSYKLVSPQGHHSMEGRQIVVETTLAEVLKDPNSGIHRHKVFSIWPKHEYKGHRWGMTIDLNACTGCGACTIACQSENNISVVGKKFVMQGREMHWIRVDRYHEGTPENPDTVFQPMLCQHCGNAPCETVCPVLATVHDHEGLNAMVYNRCVGTRYCSNNCPYKVRRFNWFNYAKKIEKPLQMALNPDVTVRTRGVMEKCTFCVQRIHEGKNAARDRGDKLKDGEIQVACQQTCPTNAIVFGDVNDEQSRVAQIFKDPRGYRVLEEWNTDAMVKYLSRVRNTSRKSTKSHGNSTGDHT